MTYNPLPPVRQRNGRVPMPPVFVRPSGVADGFLLEVVNMPPGGTTSVDGVTLSNAGASWDGDPGVVGVAYRYPNVRRGRLVHVSSPDGQLREFDLSVFDANAPQASIDWSEMRPPAAVDESITTGIIRVFGSPFTQLIANGELQRPYDGTNPPQYPLPAGETTLLFRAADGAEWRQNVNVRRGETVNVSVVRPAPPRVTVGVGLPPTIPITPATPATLTVSGPVGVVLAIVRASAPTVPLTPPTPIPATGIVSVQLPAGDYVLGARRPDGQAQQRPIRLVAGAALPVNVGPWFPAATPAPTGRLTVTGDPGWRVAIGAVGSSVPLVPPVTLPASGAVSVEWPVGRFDLAVADGPRAARQTIDVPAEGVTIDLRRILALLPALDAGTGAGAGTGATPTTANVTVTGGAGWVLTVSAAGVMVNRLPILAGGTVTFPLTPGAYFLSVDDGAGHTAAQAITVPATGLAVDVTPWLAAQRTATQGPPAAAGAVGSITLSGAPPGSLVRVSALSDFTTDDSGRPVLLSLPAGTHSVTVIPPGAPQRTGAATVTAGGNAPLAFGSMTAPAAQTGMKQVTPIEQQCGPVQSPAAWQPATACPGNELVGPDGKRYRALAVEGGVAFMALKADGTVDTSWSTGTWVALGLAGAAVAGAAWWFYGRDAKASKTENPGKAKCSCGGH